MGTFPSWQYNELKQAGVDYSDPAVVGEYDSNHLRFRGFEKCTKKGD